MIAFGASADEEFHCVSIAHSFRAPTFSINESISCQFGDSVASFFESGVSGEDRLARQFLAN